MIPLLGVASLAALCVELGRMVRRERTITRRAEAARRHRERFAIGAIDVAEYDQAMTSLQEGKLDVACAPGSQRGGAETLATSATAKPSWVDQRPLDARDGAEQKGAA